MRENLADVHLRGGISPIDMGHAAAASESIKYWMAMEMPAAQSRTQTSSPRLSRKIEVTAAAVAAGADAAAVAAAHQHKQTHSKSIEFDSSGCPVVNDNTICVCVSPPPPLSFSPLSLWELRVYPCIPMWNNISTHLCAYMRRRRKRRNCHSLSLSKGILARLQRLCPWGCLSWLFVQLVVAARLYYYRRALLLLHALKCSLFPVRLPACLPACLPLLVCCYTSYHLSHLTFAFSKHYNAS